MPSTIYRAKKDAENPFRTVRRATFEDERLSWEARGLLVYLLVKPDDWRINVDHLIDQAPGGRDRMYRIINELIELRYIKRTEVREHGKISGYDYAVYEEPYTEEPEQIELLTGEPYTEKPDTVEPLPEKPYTVLPLTANTYITKEEKELNTTLPPNGGRKAPPDEETKERRRQLHTAWVEANDAKHYNRATVNTGIAELDKADCSALELVDCVRWMRLDPYWGNEKTILPQSIYKKLDEFRRLKERKKIHTNGHGSPNGTSTWANAFANRDEPEYIKLMKQGVKG